MKYAADGELQSRIGFKGTVLNNIYLYIEIEQHAYILYEVYGM